MFATKAALVVSVLFAAGVLRDRRSFANAILLGLALALLGLATAERLARADDVAGRLVLLAVFALVALLPFLVAVYLVVNGLTMVRRESLRPANLLSLLAGLGILAVTGFWLAAPLTRSGELALSATIVMLLFGYVSFQCVSFVLYAFLYGRLSVPRAADFVVVLGSGLLDGGRVPPLLASRLDRGYAVYRALAARGGDPVLLVSGGKGSDEQVSEADAMAGYLAARGFPADRIYREDRSANTEENLANSQAIMDRLRPGATCVIVTSNYHVFRTAMIARRFGIRGQVTGARTAGYYWPSATLREFGAVFLSYKAVNLAICFLLVAVPVTATLLTGPG
ncbi:MAG TPA: YdcF family protein [Streptosporangiaceae bacterium]|nr:YdcF family protein [Streptosporangiaceae bacterium]